MRPAQDKKTSEASPAQNFFLIVRKRNLFATRCYLATMWQESPFDIYNLLCCCLVLHKKKRVTDWVRYLNRRLINTRDTLRHAAPKRPYTRTNHSPNNQWPLQKIGRNTDWFSHATTEAQHPASDVRATTNLSKCRSGTLNITSSIEHNQSKMFSQRSPPTRKPQD